MLKMIVTDAGVSKGYDGAPALRFIDLEGGGQCVRFRIGKRVYDNRCENNHRWINLSVKAFGEACERIKKMKLKEGSFVNIIARYDEETWEDQTTHEKKSAPVLIVDDILATGGTLDAMIRLVGQSGATVAGCCMLMELDALGGRKVLGDIPLSVLLHV